jgi:hypothetical protein
LVENGQLSGGWRPTNSRFRWGISAFQDSHREDASRGTENGRYRLQQRDSRGGSTEALRLVKQNATLENFLATMPLASAADIPAVCDFFLNPLHTDQFRLTWKPPAGGQASTWCANMTFPQSELTRHYKSCKRRSEQRIERDWRVMARQ